MALFFPPKRRLRRLTNFIRTSFPHHYLPLALFLLILTILFFTSPQLIPITPFTIFPSLSRLQTFSSRNCTGILIEDECIQRNQIRKFGWDPCNPRGHRLVRRAWKNMGKRRGVVSPNGFGTLERHRFTCMMLPTLLRGMLEDRRRERRRRYDVKSLKWSYRQSRIVRAIRVLAFGPKFDDGIARMFEEVGEKYPVDYVVSDVDSKLLRDMKVGGHNFSVEEIPFPDLHFDVVVCIHTLEQVPELEKALVEIKRVLAPGGVAVLHSPVRVSRKESLEDRDCISSGCRKKKFGSPYLVRKFGRDFGGKLESVFGDGNVGVGSMREWLGVHRDLFVQVFNNPEFKDTFGEIYAVVRKDGGSDVMNAVWDELEFDNEIEWRSLKT